MQTATLGGLIKDYRLKKRLSQIEVSSRIGWNDTTRLSKIEQGRVGKPTRETVDKIIKALSLTQEERVQLLLSGGYLPSDEEIKDIIKKVSPLIDEWDYPAYIYDFSWRVVYANKKAYRLFHVPESFDLFKYKPTLLDFVFTEGIRFPVKLKANSPYNKFMTYEEAMVAQFKIEHLSWETDKWYKDMVKRLIASDYFRKIWSKVDIEKIDRLLLDYEPLKIIDEKLNKEFSFHVFTPRVIADHRFIVSLYIPKS